MDTTYPYYRPDTTPEEPRLIPEEKQVNIATELDLGISDEEFADVIQARIDDSKAFYTNKLKLYERQKRNELFYLGQQINEAKLKPYQVGYVDNILYEAVATIIPIAMSRLPDLTVKPGQDTPEQKASAELLTRIMNADIRKRENRKVMELALKHLFLYYFGVIKYRWDKSIGTDGDYVFETIHPSNIIIDHTAVEPDPNKMQFIAQTIERSVKEMIMDFPNKEAEIYAELVGEGLMGEGQLPNEDILASKVKYTEIWFSWLKKKKTWEKGENEYERIEGVAWKYRHTLLRKMKNPNYDYEGTDKLVEGLDPQQAVMQAMLGQEVPTETQYYNYFQTPQKPFIILTFDQLGRYWLDETTIIEQNIKLQQNVNKRGIQITDMLDKARGKDVFNKSLFEKKDIEEASMYDSSTDLFADLPPNASITDAYVHVAGEMPSSAAFQDQQINREHIFAKMGVNSTTRGMVTPESTATEAQIARESDFGRIDYLVEMTVNKAAEEIARATMQMIKLRYDSEHMVRLIGDKGQMLFERLSQDAIQDGMEVVVGASGTDKTMRKTQALQLAKMGMIDPLTLLEELQVSDPHEKARKLLLFQSNPQAYMMELDPDGGQLQQIASIMAGQQQAPVPPEQQPPMQAPSTPPPQVVPTPQ